MKSYATIAEIIAASKNIPAIATGEDGDIAAWANEAYVHINNYCRQNFDFESQTTRTVRVSYNPSVFLPKVISGAVTLYESFPGDDPAIVDNDLYLELEPYSHMLRYTVRNGRIGRFNPPLINLSITADWGYAISWEQQLVIFANAVSSRYTTHIASSTFHTIADTTNLLTAPAATDLATATALLNNIKTKFNLHITAGAVHPVASVSPIISPTATGETSALALATEIRTKFNAHIVSSVYHVVADTRLVLADVTTELLPDGIKTAFIKVTQRLAIRDNPEDLRYMNSGFMSESFSDGYSYSLNEPSLRGLILPNDAVLLSPYINDGQAVY